LHDTVYQGKISASEVKDVFIRIDHPMSNEEIDFLFKAIDENGDGV
jgi:Ca2+-binding EF-hand superfamily protein